MKSLEMGTTIFTRQPGTSAEM